MKRLLIGFLCLCLLGFAALAEDLDVVESGGTYDYDSDTYSSYTEYANGDTTYKVENSDGVTTHMYDAKEDSWHTVHEDADGNMTVIDEKDGQGSIAYYPNEGYVPDDDEKAYRDEYGSYTPAHPTDSSPTYVPDDDGKAYRDEYGSYTPAHPTNSFPAYTPSYTPAYIPAYTSPSVTSASGTAWVQTSGGRLNVRAYPSTNADVLRKIENGTQVTITGYSGEWTQIYVSGTHGYVMSRYLRHGYAPTPVPPYPATEKTATEQYATMTSISPRTVTVHPSRVGGFVNLRWAPSTREPVIRYCYEGYTLTAIAANAEWLQVLDPATYQVGFMMRAYVSGI
ncbi:MAG: SH3 domain-containing protein [Clostridiales bacterium]|nr:SH3 domain-containing protein [Clostridiales bacterium]